MRRRLKYTSLKCGDQRRSTTVHLLTHPQQHLQLTFVKLFFLISNLIVVFFKPTKTSCWGVFQPSSHPPQQEILKLLSPYGVMVWRWLQISFLPYQKSFLFGASVGQWMLILLMDFQPSNKAAVATCAAVQLARAATQKTSHLPSGTGCWRQTLASTWCCHQEAVQEGTEDTSDLPYEELSALSKCFIFIKDMVE